jgi:hypothetical protein
MSRLVRVAVLLAIPLAGCAGGDVPTGPDGVYQRTTGGATWTLALAGSRFAITRSDRQGCAWTYGGMAAHGQRLRLRAVDARGSLALPTDELELRWTRYRQVLELRALTPGPATRLAGPAWRQRTRTRSWRTDRCTIPAAALTPTGIEHARPTGAVLGFSGDFVRRGATRWEGRGASRQLGRGSMTLQGPVVLGEHTRARVVFVLHVRAGVLRGCAIASILRRPHRRYVWDGPGQITATSPSLRQYLALSGGIGGVTYTHARDRMHGGFGSYPGTRPRGRSRPDVVC